MKFGRTLCREWEELPDILEFGPYKIDREQRLLLRGDRIIPLAPKVFDLLLFLAESGGRVLEKKILLDALWPDTFVEEGSLTRNISSLRKSWGENPDDQNYISTVPRRGYRFVAQVHQTRTSGKPEARRGTCSVLSKSPTRAISEASHIPHAQQKHPAIIWCDRGDGSRPLRAGLSL